MRLTVRAYNVGHGDCILISWDEDDGVHHAWVDFGTHHEDDRTVYPGAYDDILARTGGRIDLLLMTHRHLDHFEGFYTLRDRLAVDFQVERVWHAHVTPAVDSQFKIASETLDSVLPRELQLGAGVIGDVYRNNLEFSNVDRMNAITAMFPSAVFQVHRQTALAALGALPAGLSRMKIEVLAPEEDSNAYLTPIDTSLAARQALDDHFAGFVPGAATNVTAAAMDVLGPERTGKRAKSAKAMANEGAKADEADERQPDFLRLADFARLRRMLRAGGLDLLAAVNKSRNNTSVVTRWRWEGITLLLTGDAELESWALMRNHGDDLGASMLKISHHGSIDASPAWGFERVFPSRRSTNSVILSTNPLIFPTGNEVPKAEVVAAWAARLRYPSRFRRTDMVPRGEAVELRFDR